MSEENRPIHGYPLSETMRTWLNLRREMEDRIADPETLERFHEFMMVDQVLFEEESREAFERGVIAGKKQS